MVYEATVSAPVNIACIKCDPPLRFRLLVDDWNRYWGKRDIALILPTNSSLSITLDQDHLQSTTTSRCEAEYEGPDRLWLNGKEEGIKQGGRMSVCIRELRRWRAEMESKDPREPKVDFLTMSSNHRSILPG